MKKLLHQFLLAATLFFTATAMNAQWKSIPPVYGGAIANDGAVCFSFGGKGYAVAGSSTNKVYAYDTLTNKWSYINTIPASMGHAFAMSFVINSKAYVVGGDTSGVPVSSVWELDLSSTLSQWTQKKDFPGGVRDAGFGFALHNQGYIGAGFSGTALHSDIWKYDAENDTWTQLPISLPISGLIFPTSFVIGNKGYILTGGTAPSGVNEISSMWCLDGLTDSLSERADFPGDGRQAAFAFSSETHGFVGGGQASYTTNYDDMWKYDAAKDEWTAAPKAPLLGAAWASTFVIGNSAYVGLGAKFVTGGLTGNDVFYKFPLTASLTEVTEMQPADNHYTLYPNPASELLRIQTDGNEPMQIEFFSSLGERVISRRMENNEQISVATLPAGMYCVKITSANNSRMGYSLQKVQISR